MDHNGNGRPPSQFRSYSLIPHYLYRYGGLEAALLSMIDFLSRHPGGRWSIQKDGHTWTLAVPKILKRYFHLPESEDTILRHLNGLEKKKVLVLKRIGWHGYGYALIADPAVLAALEACHPQNGRHPQLPQNAVTIVAAKCAPMNSK